ncbi:Adenylate and Guanylate cyclase catalytic domain protein [uncultured Desulfatiglans sp.]|uniref:Adenylate and Guanylate cyclase catalytic domain protein n=1 Tax=Uncultured Desulfatiglans sp. TaxID=1748965 RepID=A0A653A812_UNCDX|nr:Adenylate and Guanylate cyclase catalytic domain protein [uncultured Desulfatiglans sp.]
MMVADNPQKGNPLPNHAPGRTPPLDSFPMLGLYLRNLGANLLGFGIVLGLNLLTPLGYFRDQTRLFLIEGGWMRLLLWETGIMLFGAGLQVLLQRPISSYATCLRKGATPAPRMRERAERRAINLPFVIALANFGMWVAVPAILVTGMWLWFDTRTESAVFGYFRSVMVGMITATASFFLLEDYLRRGVLPALFPEGRLAAVPGTIKLPILRRIRFLYTAGTLIPMIMLVGTLYLSLKGAGQLAPGAREVAEEILLFCFFLCSVFVLFALRLNFLVGRSISSPLTGMMRVIRSVRQGDFTKRIRVVSNDEIGILGDAGNAMIAGLAEREQIRETFGLYVSPEIRDEILSGRIPLEGERRIGTLLFSDLRDFTAYVERHSPEEVIRSLRAYFTEMGAAVRAHNGLVLQYVGDEQEAVFGVPVYCEDHADRAILAALEMRRRLAALNEERVRSGLVPFRHGIGIHTGEVLTGNTGSESRRSYALIGDTVNIASRVQDLTKTLKCDILVSEDTVSCLRSTFPLTAEPPQTLKGHTRMLAVYRLD